MDLLAVLVNDTQRRHDTGSQALSSSHFPLVELNRSESNRNRTEAAYQANVANQSEAPSSSKPLPARPFIYTGKNSQMRQTARLNIIKPAVTTDAG